ncbi:alpha/beta hydrolase [Alteromonas macleodii]|uniref:Carbohydrate esterase, family CE1 n=1 Tax=Alteromonas macleodii TaxID=28108 RepID=A0A6T9Y1R7_ALTMA|nr:alpha/beta hydrolase-fold protein [Alteromonas macleodii]CAB9493652.1 Carbohydrate esterase, family CE1 [Alteromonas macleodii]
MTVKRLEVSNPRFTSDNLTLITVHSSAVNGRRDISVYNAHPESKDLPVVVLLHGVYGNHWVWMNLGGVHEVYKQLHKKGLGEFVLVMPSDGALWDGSGYLPLKEHGNYETWIVEDVKDAVTQTIDAVSKQSNWYISGLSMGGFGALRLGAKYPSVYKGISAHSAITCMDDFTHFVDYPIETYCCEHEYETDLMYWLSKSKNELPSLRLDCGYQDVLYESNKALTSQLRHEGISFDFEWLDGGHEWSYWHRNVEKTLRFFDQIQKRL